VQFTPDGVFALTHIETGKTLLFFLVLLRISYWRIGPVGPV
jgi:hypothetical protein